MKEIEVTCKLGKELFADEIQAAAIKALGGGGGGGASATNGGYNSGSSASSQNYAPELTVKIQGKLRGSDIVMSEENTKDKWNR